MARAISENSISMFNVRVSAQTTFIPAHFKNGKRMQARIIIPIMTNSHRGTDQRTGEAGRKDNFKLVLWGQRALTAAKSCSIGKELDVIGELNSYRAPVYNADGSLRLDSTGKSIEITKYSIKVSRIIFGDESPKFIANDIQSGKRPADYNIPGSAGYNTWMAQLTARKALRYTGVGDTFGYARVSVPAGVQLDLSEGTGQTLTNQVAAAANTGYAAPSAAPSAAPAAPATNTAPVNTGNVAVF